MPTALSRLRAKYGRGPTATQWQELYTRVLDRAEREGHAGISGHLAAPNLDRSPAPHDASGGFQNPPDPTSKHKPPIRVGIIGAGFAGLLCRAYPVVTPGDPRDPPGSP